MNARNPIERLIEAKQARVSSLERTLAKLQIELATLREAQAALVASVFDEADAEPVSEPAAEGKRGRSLSADWKAVLKAIAGRRNDGASLDEIEGFCRQNSISIKRPTLRAQMSNYVKRGYLGRTGEGKFQIALHGMRVAGLLPEEDFEHLEYSGTPAQTGAPEKEV